MSKRRRNSSSPESDDYAYSPRNRTNNGHSDEYQAERNSPISDSDEGIVDETPRLDPVSGQTGAFPGLGDSSELFYGPANDGLDYLRMVQSERQGIPGLLRSEQAEHRDDYADESDDAGYWDDDGTYVAAPVERQRVSKFSQAQEYYYASLLEQYQELRSHVQNAPPLSAIEKLTSAQPISFPRENRNARSSWEQCLLSFDPTPTQIACMDQTSIFQLLSLFRIRMRKLLRSPGFEVVKRLGAWVWSALAKCAERGALGSEEISDLRNLAQKAIDTRDWLEHIQSSDEIRATVTEDSSDSDVLEENAGDAKQTDLTEGIEAAKARLMNGDRHESAGEYTRDEDGKATDETSVMAEETTRAKEGKFVILDMIIIVVGEFYGQRDLLESRKAWNSE